MEFASFQRLCYLLLIGLVILVSIRSWFLHVEETDFIDCSIYSPWCTFKNRFQATSNLFLDAQRPTYRDHQTDHPHHPLDPLTIQEINKALSILQSHPPFISSFPAIHSLVLEEPHKPQVLNWKKGDPLPPRAASVIAFSQGHSHILSIDLNTAQVTLHEINEGSGYPILTSDDVAVALSTPFADAEFNRTILARGVELSDLICVPLAPGWYGAKEDGRRLVKVQCFSNKGTANYYMRPIEGLTVTVDVDQKKVVHLSNTGSDIPIPKAQNTDYRQVAQNDPLQMLPINPISMEQPKGPSFRVENGHLIKWANWEFHLKPDPRAGVVVSRAMVRDSETGRMRSVMYKGMASELFVPYMDPTEGWYFKTYLDAGEYGMGLTALPLDPLNDCPRYSYYMDGVFAAADGRPYVRPNMVCVFERYAGEIGWRHAESPIWGQKGDFYLGKRLHNWVIRLGFEEYVVVQSSILDMYAKCGCLDGAHRLFETMTQRDVVVWNAMILGLGRAGFSLEVLCAFRKMQFDGVKMDSRTIPSVLNACGREGDLLKGKEVHGQVVKNLAFSCDAVIGNSLMDMYAKCGCLDDLSRVFANMRDQNLVTWTTLISCYGVHGKGKESLILFEEMIAQGIEPNCVTFTAVLASCSHSGLVDEGHRIFESMKLEYGVEPSVEHYACMVDLLGRIGRLQEALELIKGMQQEPSASIWGALLGACQIHKNVDLGEIAAFKLFELETANSSNYIALCSIYDAVGKWDGVSKMRKRMRELGLVKTPGCSWINMKGRVHRFYQGDISHPMKIKIYEILNLLSKMMVLPEGYG